MSKPTTPRRRISVAIVVALSLLCAAVILVISISGSYLFTLHTVDANRCHNVTTLEKATAKDHLPAMHAAYEAVAAKNGCS